MSWTTRLARWAPVRAVHVERVAFDTHAVSKGEALAGVDHRHGTLYGTEARAYLLAKWGKACAYCGTTGVPLNIDHIHPRSRGGSDRISNLCTACVPCNEGKSNQPVEDFLRQSPERLALVLAQAKAPLHDAAAVNATHWALWHALDAAFPTVRTASGSRTKWNRLRTGTPKSHTLDVLCVGELQAVDRAPARVLVVTATGRGSYSRTRTDKHGFPASACPGRSGSSGTRPGTLPAQSCPRARTPGLTPAALPSAPAAASTSGPHAVSSRAFATNVSASSSGPTATPTPTDPKGPRPLHDGHPRRRDLRALHEGHEE